MKTIKFLNEALTLAKSNGTPANIEVGTFKIKSQGSLHFWAGTTGTFDNYSLSFEIEFRPDHIQMLLNLGVKIDFNSAKMSGLSESAKRFKSGREAIKQGRFAPYYYMGDPANAQTGVVENWLIASATCSIETLVILDKICRDNHLHHIAIHNDHTITEAGFRTRIENNLADSNDVKSHRERIESIRKQVRKLSSKKTTAYQIACSKKYNF